MRAFKILTAFLFLAAVGFLYHWTETVRRFPDARATFKILDRSGSLLTEEPNPQFGRRNYRDISAISPSLLQAVIDQEDRRFFSHHGLDPKAIGRAILANLKSHSFSQGGSTITQQTAKILLENRRGGRVPRTLFWKMAEAALALDLELHESKEEILERYLNSVYLGHRLYGVEAASEAYFGKSARDLNSQESILIAQRIRRPNQGRELLPRSLVANLAPHLPSMIPGAALGRNEGKGDRILTTTLQADIQQMALDSVSRELAILRRSDPALQAAAVVIDVPTGELRALVGSESFNDFSRGGQVNHALALRQPGSTLKPFTYFLAFLHHWTPSHLLIDAPYHFYLAEDESYTPRNFDRKYHGVMPVREALANSYNVPAVLTLEQMGGAAYLSLLHQFGFHSLDQGPSFYGLALTLGSGSVRLTELTNAFAALARGGEVRPLKIISGNESEKDLAETHYPTPEEEKAAFYITNILSDPEARRRAFGDGDLMSLDRQPVAVKTGTSHDSHDAWAVGYSPRYAVGIWTGHTDNSPMPGLTGAEAAIPLWHAIMSRLHEGVSPMAFRIPAGVEKKAFCRDSSCDVVKADWQGEGAETNLKPSMPQESLRILRPVDGDHFLIDPRQAKDRQKILCEVRIPAPSPQSITPGEGLRWFLDGQELGAPNQGNSKTFLDLNPGKHELRVALGNEKSRPVRITVSEMSQQE